MMKFSRINSMDEKAAASISGELSKLDDNTLKWHPFWFAVEGEALNWYENSREEDSKGGLDLKTLTKCDMEPEDLSIYMYTPAMELTVRAKSDGEMNMWHRAIEMYADMARGGDGTGRLSGAPKIIQRTGPGVHSAEFDHASHSGKFTISRDGPGMHSFDCAHATRSGKFSGHISADTKPIGDIVSAPAGGPVWRSDKMTGLDDGRDLTYDEKEESDDIFSAEPKPYLESHHQSSVGEEKLITRNKSNMYHSQEVKY